jgi:hypothetical protein
MDARHSGTAAHSVHLCFIWPANDSVPPLFGNPTPGALRINLCRVLSRRGTRFPQHYDIRVCIFATDVDPRVIHLHDWSAFDMISGLEREMNFTMHQGASLVQNVEAHFSARPEDARQ